MKSIIINLIIFCTAQWSILKAQTITVTNTTDKQRQELVSIDASQLDIDVNKGVVVHDAFGIEQASQLTYDGMFLLDVHVRPSATATYTIQAGQPAPVRSWVNDYSCSEYPAYKDLINVGTIHSCESWLYSE